MKPVDGRMPLPNRVAQPILKRLAEAAAETQSHRGFQHDFVIAACLKFHCMNSIELHNGRAMNAYKPLLPKILFQLQQCSTHDMRLTSDMQAGVTTYRLDPVDIRNFNEQQLTATLHYESPGMRSPRRVVRKLILCPGQSAIEAFIIKRLQ